MTSNSKMVVFFLAATVFNILLMAIIVAAVLGIAILINTAPWSLIIAFVGFIGSIVVTFLVYGAVMKWVTVRFNLEKHIPQLFKGRKR